MHTQRRQLLLGFAAVGTTALAGCSGGDGDERMGPETPSSDLLPDTDIWAIEAETPQYVGMVDANDGVQGEYTGPDDEEYIMEIFRFSDEQSAEDGAEEIYGGSWLITFAHGVFTFSVNGRNSDHARDLLAASPGLDADTIDAKTSAGEDLFTELNGRELNWNGDCPPTNYKMAESIAAAPENAGYTIETEADGSATNTIRGEQESEGASALYSDNDELPLRVSVNIWDTPEVAENVADGSVSRLSTFWRGESVTFDAGILSYIPESRVTADFHTTDNEYTEELVEFYLTVPCFNGNNAVDISW